MNTLVLIIILAVLIFVHEAGHFGVAKWIGAKVESFAIGFKPTLFSTKIGETIYKLNLIPFGGYVTLHDESSDDFNPEDPRAFPNRPRWQQALVLVAGVIANLLLAWVLFVVIAFMQVDGSFFATLGQSFVMTGKAIWLTLAGFGDLIAGIFTPAIETGELIGPVGLADVVGQARTIGIVSVFTLTSFISINLAILNILPFPALDGGRLLFLGIEKIRGKKISPKVAGIVNGFGFFFLIILMIVVTVKDVVKLV